MQMNDRRQCCKTGPDLQALPPCQSAKIKCGVCYLLTLKCSQEKDSRVTAVEANFTHMNRTRGCFPVEERLHVATDERDFGRQLPHMTHILEGIWFPRRLYCQAIELIIEWRVRMRLDRQSAVSR